MKRLHKNKLIVNRRIIVTHLTDLEGVLDYLIAKQVITPALRNRINQNITQPDRIRQFLDCLIDCKPPLVFQYFLEALVLTGNSSIADVLEPDYSSSESCLRLIELEKLTQERHISSFNNQIVFSLNNNSNSNNHVTNSINEPQNLQYPIACTQPDASSNPYNLIFSNEPPPVRNLLRNHNLSSPLFANQRNSYYHPSFVREANSNRASTNSSLSPSMCRARSSSVNAAVSSIREEYNANGLYSQRRRNFNVKSFDETASASSSSNSSISNLAINKLPIPVSDQDQPQLNQPPCTYNIDWSDVNKLELDFEVNKSWPPNLKNQLSPNECYQMEKEPRGICAIINNENFYENGKKNDELRRRGTDMDASRLRNLFEKLKFRVDMHVDLTEIKMRQAINNLANEANLNANNFDAICLIVLTHGSDGYLHGIDLENKINIDFILNIFDDVLIGKPKLFIFQACRGEYLNQKNINILTTNSTTQITSSCSSSNINMEIIQKEESQIITQDIPVQQPTTSEFKYLPTPPVTPNTPNTPKSASQTSILNDVEETVKNFRNIKITSGSHQTTKELMFKKNTNKSSKNLKNIANDNDSPSPKKLSSNCLKKARSRSHSRSKYTNYIASAATALFSAIKTSPSHLNTKSTISTQTSIEKNNNINNRNGAYIPIEIPSSSEIIQSNGLCYTDINIYATNNNSQSLINFIDGRPIKTSLPSRSDFFIWYSSVRGFVSHRDPDGSPFIKCLVTVFSRCAYESELIEMVRKVNFLMQQYEKKHMNERNSIAYYFMVPVVEYHLTKRLYFNP